MYYDLAVAEQLCGLSTLGFSSIVTSTECCADTPSVACHLKGIPRSSQWLGVVDSELQEQQPVRSIAGAFCGSRSSTCSVQECCRSVLLLLQHQLQRPGALQERLIAPEAAVAAPRSVQLGSKWSAGGAKCNLQGVQMEQAEPNGAPGRPNGKPGGPNGAAAEPNGAR